MASPPDPDGPWTMDLGPQGVEALNGETGSQMLLVPYRPQMASSGPVDRWFGYDVSSNGWAAVRIGAGQSEGAAPRLFIVKLPEADVIAELQLLSNELASRMSQSSEDGFLREVTDDPFVAIHNFTWGDSLSWNPEGDKLAFVAARSGPSADIYLYSIRSQELLRLTDGPNQPYINGWSPDGKWVVHQEIANLRLGGQGIEYDPIALWAAAADGGASIRVESVEDPVLIKEWISPTRFVASSHSFTPAEEFRLQLVDLFSGVVTTYYPGHFYAWAVDPMTGTVAFAASSPRLDPDSEMQEGLYLYSPASGSATLVGFAPTEVEDASGLVASVEWSPELGVFEVTARNGELTRVTTEGLVVPCGDC